MIQVVQVVSVDDMHSENLWFSWSKPSNYREKLRCHARDIRTKERANGGKWKIEQCSGRPKTTKYAEEDLACLYFQNAV